MGNFNWIDRTVNCEADIENECKLERQTETFMDKEYNNALDEDVFVFRHKLLTIIDQAVQNHLQEKFEDLGIDLESVYQDVIENYYYY